ncbi:hypothetical protein PTTG_26630 [Puccinia triticina 1-1 BBBD Race 1]|uniref:Uncharacterized protein n=1 Tax=Puccinia triticina (isolate 1-1 / race 1 (BBBD)) TaxID=630390 RepID=A0A180GRV8_PUCT1|nr:hypothetical protein PTTG_26630 [Puccinia triticina 1-1 BBBD Race 1]
MRQVGVTGRQRDHESRWRHRHTRLAAPGGQPCVTVELASGCAANWGRQPIAQLILTPAGTRSERASACCPPAWFAAWAPRGGVRPGGSLGCDLWPVKGRHDLLIIAPIRLPTTTRHRFRRRRPQMCNMHIHNTGSCHTPAPPPRGHLGRLPRFPASRRHFSTSAGQTITQSPLSNTMVPHDGAGLHDALAPALRELESYSTDDCIVPPSFRVHLHGRGLLLQAMQFGEGDKELAPAYPHSGT